MAHKVIRLVSDDFIEVVDLWEESVRQTHHFLAEKDIAYFKPLILNEYLKMVDLHGVRFGNGKLAGFLGVADKKIEMLFVHPEAMGQGIGKLLLRFALTQLDADVVDVNEQNEQAVGFYMHMGFRIKSRSPLDSLGMPFPILHMELR